MWGAILEPDLFVSVLRPAVTDYRVEANSEKESPESLTSS